MARRILLLITDLKIGGTPTVVRDLAIRLKPFAHVEVACLAEWGPVAGQLRDAGIDVTPLGATRPTDFHVVRDLIRFIYTKKLDTVFSFLMHANAVAAIASQFCPNVRFVQSIQTTQPWPRWHWMVQRVVQHAAGKVVVPSQSIATVARDWADVPANKIMVIPNAIDVHAFSLSPGTLGEGRGEGSFANIECPGHQDRTLTLTLSRNTGRGEICVGFLGRLDPIKHVTDLVNAVSLLEERFVLHIFGEGRDCKIIELEVEKLRLNDRVTLHGSVAKPQAALQAMDLLVLPSEAEGMPMVVIEAMAAGVPVVATDAPGIRDVVRHDVTGLLVPVGSPTQLAAAIDRLTKDAGLRAKLVRNARMEVQANYSWDRVLPLYRQVLGIDAQS